jgi:hypothetical protein
MACDQEFVPPFGPADTFLNSHQISQFMQAGRKAGVVKSQVQDISAQPTNLLGKGVVSVGDDQTVELTGAISEKLLSGSHAMPANVNLSHGSFLRRLRSCRPPLQSSADKVRLEPACAGWLKAKVNEPNARQHLIAEAVDVFLTRRPSPASLVIATVRPDKATLDV